MPALGCGRSAPYAQGRQPHPRVFGRVFGRQDPGTDKGDILTLEKRGHFYFALTLNTLVWCRLGAGCIVTPSSCRLTVAWSGEKPDRLDDRQQVGIRQGRCMPLLVDADAQVSRDPDAQVSRIAWGDAPRRHGCRHAARLTGGQGRIDGCARRPQSRSAGISSTRQAAVSRDLRKARGARRDTAVVLDRSLRCRGVSGALPSSQWFNDIFPRLSRLRTRSIIGLAVRFRAVRRCVLRPSESRDLPVAKRGHLLRQQKQRVRYASMAGTPMESVVRFCMRQHSRFRPRSWLCGSVRLSLEGSAGELPRGSWGRGGSSRPSAEFAGLLRLISAWYGECG